MKFNPSHPPTTLIKSCSEKVTSLVNRLPALKHMRFDFITIHYVYIISCALVGSVVIYSRGELNYIDALFLMAGAATQSGLNSVDLNLLHTYQQVFLYIISMATNPVWVSSFVVFIRLYWFEKRFQSIVRGVKPPRPSKTFAGPKGEHNANGERTAVRGQPIVVSFEASGEPRSRAQQDKPRPQSSSETRKPNRRSDSILSIQGAGLFRQSDSTPTALAPERLPSHLSPEHHIALLENQRRSTGALRIPSPREYDRGDVPLTVNDGEGIAKMEFCDLPDSPQIGHHITINEPHMLPSRTGGSVFPRTDSRRTMPDEQEDGESVNLGRIRTRRLTLDSIVRSLTEERERDTLPYLSWNATVGRNSAFANLTEDQRKELGGIEYRALKTLAVVLISYFLLFHALGVVCLVPWILSSGTYGSVVTSDGQGRPWWAVFTSASAFNDVGFSLTPDSMNSFQDAIFPLLLLAFLIIIGNTGFPCMLRFMIWILSIVVRTGTPLWEELQFLLDHPRRCFTLLFPRNATWWLFAVLIILNGLDLVLFIILDFGDPVVTSLPPGIRVVDGLFQAVSTRTAGFSVINLAGLHPGVQVSYLVMMYISAFPVAISVRRTNVYEERSLGIYSSMERERDTNREPNYIGSHLRRQLSFDLWYLFLGLFIISIVEGDRIQDPAQNAFNLFTVLFEIVSAYGTVGLSLGYPGVNTAFSGQFRPISKLVVIAMQIRGRHRGLPYALDRAILLPSEPLHRAEAAEADRRLRHRNSNFSEISAIADSAVSPRERGSLSHRI